MKTALDYLSNALGNLTRAFPTMEEEESKQAMRLFKDALYLKSYATLLQKYGQSVYTVQPSAEFFVQALQTIGQLFPPDQLKRHSYGRAREATFDFINNFLQCIHAIIAFKSDKTTEFSTTIVHIIDFSRKHDGLDCIQQALNELLSLLKNQAEKDESLMALILQSILLPPISENKKIYRLIESLYANINFEEITSMEALGHYLQSQESKMSIFRSIDDEKLDSVQFMTNEFFLSQQNLPLSLKKNLLNQLFQLSYYKNWNGRMEIIQKWFDKISKEEQISKEELFLDESIIDSFGASNSVLNTILESCYHIGELLEKIHFLIKNGFPIAELMEQQRFKSVYKAFLEATDGSKKVRLIFDDSLDVVNDMDLIDRNFDIFANLLASISEQVTLPEWYFLLPESTDWKIRIFLASKIKSCEEVDAYLLGINKLTHWFSAVHKNEHAQSFEDFFMKNQVLFEQLIDIMGVNAFDFLEKYFAETTTSLEKMLESIILCSIDTRELMCVCFEQNKVQILEDATFFKIWEAFLVSFSRLPDSLSRTVNTWDSEKKTLFLNNYRSFIIKFTDINEYANSRDPIHFREIAKFFSTFSVALGELIEIMDETAFSFFQKYLGATVISLEKLLEKILPMPSKFITQMAELFKHYQSEIMDGSQHFKRWENILITAGLMVELNKKIRGQEKSICTLLLGEPVSLRPENLELLEQTVMSNFFKTAFYSLELTEEEIARIDVNALMGKISSQDLPKLILAQQKMKDDRYYAIFIQLFKSYLLNDSIESIVHGSESEKPIDGSALDKLVQHNQVVRQALIDGHINPHYPDYNKKLTFTYEKGNIADNHILSVFKTLWSDLEQVKQQTEEALPALRQEEKTDTSSLALTQTLENLLKRIIELKKNFDKKSTVSEHKKYASLLNDANKNLFLKVYNSLNGLKTRYSEQLSPGFLEYATHYTDRFNAFKALAEKRVTPKTQLFESKKFTVAHWDKNKISSLFLGSPVQCCLAPDGHQFPALIQRLMDDAMFFHVVTEGNSETPVALSWLYFVRDANNPEHIYVMSNFLEISPKYGSDADAKQVIINALLYYTDQFAQNIGAKGFLVNHLRYGWINNFDVFEQAEINPQKVGGCLTLDNSVQESKVLYYLDSLQRNSFHQYNLDKIPMEQQVRFLTLPNEVSYSSATTLAAIGAFSVAKGRSMEIKCSTQISPVTEEPKNTLNLH